MVRRVVPYIRSKSLHLLVSLVALIMASPFFEGTRMGHLALNVLLCVTLLSVANVTSNDRRIKLGALALSVLVIYLIFAESGSLVSPTGTAGLILYAVIIVATIALVLRRIVKARVVNFDLLCDSVGVYLLIGLFWTLVFMAMDTLYPGAFDGISLTMESGWSDFLYFSFSTLTTLGYGDITPAGNVARVWSSLEAVTGVFYIAVLVARLVSIYRA